MQKGENKMAGVFLNPYTDYGFKKLFGEEASKPFLIDFLNSLLPDYHQIADLTLRNSEQMGLTDFDRKAIYDIFCENEKGEKFIVELQRAKQTYFKDRTLYYATFPISEQGQKGEWQYQLKAVYCISILDFLFDEHKDDQEVIYTVQLKDQNNQVFYDKLTLKYLQMPNFVKAEYELETKLDKWLFFIKNLEDLQHIPEIFKDSVIEQAFKKAEIAQFDRQEMSKYRESLKHYWDFTNVMETQRREGVEQGIEIGDKKRLLSVIKNLLNKKSDLDLICDVTELSLPQVQQLIQELKQIEQGD